MRRSARLAAVLVVLVVASFFRLYRLDTIPPGLFFDEAQNGVDIDKVLRGAPLPIMFEAGPEVKARTREPMFLYMTTGMFVLLGPSVTVMRLTAALLGIATVVACFVLCTRLVDVRTAVVAALLLAVARWHVTFSRIGLRAILTPLWIVLTALALQRLARRRTAGAAMLLGATVGLGWYTYTAYWVVPPLLLVLLALHTWHTRGRLLRADGRLGAIAVATFLVVGAPLIGYAVAKPDYYFARAVEVAEQRQPLLGGVDTLRDNLQRVLFMLHFRSQAPAQFGLPGQPLLDPLTGLAFAIGLFVVCRRLPRAPSLHAGLLAFWLFPLLPGIAGDVPGAVIRAQGALPAVCLIAAIGLVAVGDEIAGPRSAWRQRAAAVAVALAVAAIGGLNYRDYFRDWATRPEVADAFAADVRRFFEFFADLADGNDVYLSPYVYYSPNVRFLNMQRRAPVQLLADASALTAPGGAARGRVFVCETPALSALIEELYPSAERLGRYDVFGRPTGRVYRLRADQLLPELPAAQRAEAAYWVDKMQADFQTQTRRW